MTKKMNGKMKKTTKICLLASVIAVLVIVIGLKIFSSQYSGSKKFTPAELAIYNGDDPSLPVYLALDGNVYDVSSGRKDFYDPNMPYHYLAGQDASTDLHIAGGGIIKVKYRVIGTLVK